MVGSLANVPNGFVYEKRAGFDIASLPAK